MERHVDLSSLSVRTEVSDWLMRVSSQISQSCDASTAEFIYNS